MPNFDTIAILLVVLPLTLVSGSLRVDVGPRPISLVVAPLAFIDVTVDMIELPMAESLSVAPFTFIYCPSL
jgi:hypothetical protein